MHLSSTTIKKTTTQLYHLPMFEFIITKMFSVCASQSPEYVHRFTPTTKYTSRGRETWNRFTQQGMFYGVLIFRSDTPDFFAFFGSIMQQLVTKNSKTKALFSVENGLLYSLQISSCSRTLIGIEKLAKTFFSSVWTML